MAEMGWTGAVWLTLSTLGALAACCGFFLPYWLEGGFHPAAHPAFHPAYDPPFDPFDPASHPEFNPAYDPDNHPASLPASHPESHPASLPVNHPESYPASSAGPTPVFLGAWRRCNYPRLDQQGRVELVHECGRYRHFTDIPSVWWQMTTVLCGAGSALALLVASAALTSLCVTHVLTTATARLAALLQLISGVLVGGGMALYPLGWGSSEVRQVCGDTASPYHMGTCRLYWAFYLTASAAGLTLLCSLLALCAPAGKNSRS